ncbi:MAG: hypothetical protein LC125_05025 [Burkholderiales bacterium]|nr:hypothetical protein [Burkholderiales bacterium]
MSTVAAATAAGPHVANPPQTGNPRWWRGIKALVIGRLRLAASVVDAGPDVNRGDAQ